MKAKRYWTEQEKEFLCEKWGNVSISSIAHKLNRTETAVKLKARRCGLGKFLECGDYITWNQLLIALGITGGPSYKQISWVQNRNFPIKNKRVGINNFKVVYIDDFWKWAKQNQSFIDFSKFEENALGAEPQWAKIKRKNDYSLSRIFIKTPWTKQEDEKLLKLLQEYKHTYFDLSQKLNRTEGAIQRRICDLNFKERPVKADNHIKWTDAEIELLADLVKQGLKYELIAQSIKGKSVKAIRGKVYSIYLTENLDKVRRMIGTGLWGEGKPQPQLKQKSLLSVTEKKQTKDDLSKLAYLLSNRAKALDVSSKKVA